MYCINCGSSVSPGDRFCTNCGADLHAQEVASTELVSPVGEQQDSAASTLDVASSVSATVAPAVAQAKPRRHGLVIGLSVASAVVLVIAVVLSLIATNVIPNPLVRERAVTFAIKAPHYNEKTDSKIPLHITGKTSSGRVISQHVYVSPKAPVVHLAPGQYTVQVEASPLLSSGDVYRIPEPIKIDTTKDNRLVGESKPVKQDLKFEVKPANEVTASDLQAVAKFAKKTATPVKKLDFLNEKIRRQKVATAFNQVLDMLDTGSSDKYYASMYSLLDIDQDGTPEMLTWFGVTGDKEFASDGPVGCGDQHDDFSGNRVWKYNKIDNRAECLSGEQIPKPFNADHPTLMYGFSPSKKIIRISDEPDETWISIQGDHLDAVNKSYDQIEEEGSGHYTYGWLNSDDWEDWPSKNVFSKVTERGLLATFAMSVPKELSVQGISDYDRYALDISNFVMNGGQILVGTIKVMTAQQVQEYQHQYVIDHRLDANLDPMSTDPQSSPCKNSDHCGDLASQFDDGTLIPVFITDGLQKDSFNSWVDHRVYRIPMYIYRIGGYRNMHNSGFLDTDKEFIDNLQTIANKRVIISAGSVSWDLQQMPILPWRQQDVFINNILATLPEATGQAQEKAAE